LLIARAGKWAQEVERLLTSAQFDQHFSQLEGTAFVARISERTHQAERILIPTQLDQHVS
jgi:hypothetical protein